MKVVKINNFLELPEDFTGIAEYQDGSKFWFKNGERHRIDGPAMKWADGSEYWYQNNKLHRTNGPAVRHSDGYEAYYIDGEKTNKKAVEVYNTWFPED